MKAVAEIVKRFDDMGERFPGLEKRRINVGIKAFDVAQLVSLSEKRHACRI
jgi:hypothetical protein